jgi:cytochrome c
MAPADLEAKLIHHITSGEKVKFEDGHEEEHKIVKSDDPAAIKNLVQWIMSLKAK